MKKILLGSLLLVSICASAFAAPAGFKDRLVFVGSSNAKDQVELNYYLENGGSLVDFIPIARNGSQNVCCFVHVIYPADLKVWTKEMLDNK